MENQFEKLNILLGKSNMEKIKNARIIVFGLGGVGGYVVESLVRSGVELLDIVDNDKFCITNINRQILATHKTIGRYKVDVQEERILDINPNCKINKFKVFYLPETSKNLDLSKYDYIVDAIDTVAGKIEIIKAAKELNIPIISCMGTGNRLNPTDLKIADIKETKGCALAKIMRKLCKEQGINELKVVYSEESLKHNLNKDRKLGSSIFVPATAGFIIGSEVIKDIVSK